MKDGQKAKSQVQTRHPKFLQNKGTILKMNNIIFLGFIIFKNEDFQNSGYRVMFFHVQCFGEKKKQFRVFCIVISFRSAVSNSNTQRARI